jgi:hypothetical protein
MENEPPSLQLLKEMIERKQKDEEYWDQKMKKPVAAQLET